MQEKAKLDVSIDIQNLLEKNKLVDLKRFLRKRDCLNSCNMALVYLFHIVQSAGILTTTIAASMDQKDLIWVGVGLNLVASLITVFERTNNAISKAILKDIQAIKDGTFVDEGALNTIPSDKDSESMGDKTQPLLGTATVTKNG